MKIMQKVSQWFNSLNNASKIRARYNQFFSVKNQLSAINIVLGIIAFSLITWAISYESFGVNGDAIPGALACATFFPWLCGLRAAIANSKEAKERYVQKTKRALGKLGKFIFWTAIICLILAVQGIVFCVAVKMGYFPKLVEALPALETLSQSITLQVNKMLEMLIPFVG